MSLLILLSFLSTAAMSQADLPKVFILGEHEQAYEQLVSNCNAMLLNVCDSDMQAAYSKWVTMVRDMESLSDELNFDLKGVKVWINVFWNEDGSVAHIAYYPKPNSKNINFEELTAFFVNVVNQYSFDQSHNQCFAHYGSASWPMFSDTRLSHDN